jgi:hypothetical protein
MLLKDRCFPGRVASQQRIQDQSRIRLTTRWLLYGSVAATVVFGGLAARATHAHASNASESSGAASSDDGSDDSFDDGFGGAVPPSSSTQPPVTQSGGS